MAVMNRFIATRLLLPVLGLLILAGIGVWLGGGMVRLDSSADTLLASDPRNYETFEKVNELIPDTTMVLVALEMENLFSEQGAAVVAEASRRILDVHGAVEVKSLTHSGRPVRRGFALDIEPFIPLRATPEQWERIEAFTTQFPLSRNVMVSEDGRYAIFVGVFERDLPDHAAREAFRGEFMRAMQPLKKQVEAVHVLSFPFIEAEGANALRQDLNRYLLFAAVLIGAVLFLTFRSVPAVLYVLAVEAAGVLILLGVFAAWNRPVDIYTGILFPLVGGLQLTFVTHYLAALQRSGAHHPPRRAAAEAFAEVFRPSAVAALTTIAGLLTLAFADLPTVTWFGRLGAAAVAGVFLFTFLVPALYARGTGSAAVEPAATPPDWASLPVRMRRPILLGALAVSILLALGVGRIRTDIRAVEFIEPGHPVRETLELLNHELGGTNIFQVEVDTGRPFGLQTRPVLEYLEDLRAYAYTLEGLTDAYAYSQLYIALNQIWEGDVKPTGTLPKDPAKMMMFSTLLNQSPLLFKESFVDERARSALLILRSRDMPGAEYLAMLEDFLAYAEANKPEGVTLSPVKGLHTILEGDRAIVRNQSRTLGLSLGIIALLLALLWRSARLAACVLLANLPAMLTIFGVMGYSGFPLNSITVMVAAVILGIAVDDGIHLVSAYRRLRSEGMENRRAVSGALRMKLKPMACTSSILAVFLGLLVLTSFPPVAHFGVLSSFGIAAAFLGAVLALPALLAIGRRE